MFVNPEIKRIILLNFGGIGDEILFFPVIQVLRECFPLSKIIMVVEPRSAEVVLRNFFIDEVYEFDIKSNLTLADLTNFVSFIRNNFPDIIISSGSSNLIPFLLFLSGAKIRIGYKTSKWSFLHTNAVELNTNQYASFMYSDLLKGLGFKGKAPIPNLFIPQIALEWACDLFESLGIPNDRNTLLIHPGVSKLSKQKGIIKSWDPKRWIELIKKLSKENLNIVLAGSEDDKEDLEIIYKEVSDYVFYIYNKYKTITQLAAIIKISDLLLCVDSAPMHLAVALDKPLIALFGPTDEKKLLPPNSFQFTAIKAEVDCRPCLWDIRKKCCEKKDCLNKIEVDNVYKSIMSKIGLKTFNEYI